MDTDDLSLGLQPPPIYVVREDIESPGNASQGHQSIAESMESGYSCSSQKQFLRGRTEKDVYIDSCLQAEASCAGAGMAADSDSDSEGRRQYECGIGRCRHPKLQALATIKVFVVCMCVLLTVSTTLSTGYLNSVITTIEKRFEIGSAISGLITASYEFGSLVAVVFISYLGGRRHIPKWVGAGVFLIGIGALLFALPHVMAPKYTLERGISNSTDFNICRQPRSQGGYSGEHCIDENSGNWFYVLILVMAQVLIGTGCTPILTLGTTYVDDHVAKDKAPQYLAFIYATGAFGPVVGYALGALLLQYYVDTFSHHVERLTPSHPRWVGAWWGGFVICGGILLLLGFPFLAFPKVLVREKRKMLEQKAKADLLSGELQRNQYQEPAEEFGRTIRDIPKYLLRLLRNWVYGITSLGICCEIAIVSGFVVFLPKYIETQFGTSTPMANLFTGGIAIPGAAVGILMGGYLIKRLHLRPKGAVQLALVLNIFAIFGFMFFFVLGCDNMKIAGATFPYFNSSGHRILEANLTSSCNQNCDCSPNTLEPICGINGMTYFSPCHAGCTTSDMFYLPDRKEHFYNYSGCTCIASKELSSQEVIISPLATSGACKTTCQSLLPFLILLVVMTFCVGGTMMPLLMVTLRSVREEERAFSLGMQFVMLRLFAYIPAPIMFGNAIDSACLLWRKSCGNNGSCLIYDIVQFRYRYVGIGVGLKCLGTVFYFIVWMLLSRYGPSKDSERRKDLSGREGTGSLTCGGGDKVHLQSQRGGCRTPLKQTDPPKAHNSAEECMLPPPVFTCQSPQESTV